VGALLANRLCRWSASPAFVLPMLLTAAGGAVALSPFWFMEVTRGMRYLGDDLDWGGYIVVIFARTFQTLALPAILVGAVFPYLLRTAEGSGAPGEVLGKMTAWNTLGSVTGAAAAGFVILPAAGMWGGVRFAALAYLLTALALATGASRSALAWRAVPALALLLLLTVFDPTSLPLVRSNPSRDRVLEIRQGGHGVVAVVETAAGSRRIKVNNFYRLGGSSALQHEQNQSLIPLLPHPNPQRLFYLGMGTGITAGASLRVPGVERVVVCELIPEVVEVGARYFNAFSNGLFTDPRATVLAADGRNHLRGSRDRYDAILADLFIPWKQGAGGLYSLEHFQTVRSRLEPGGIFVQWIPLYQVDRGELEIVARTMLAVFPEVVLWRGDFYPEKPILALVGSEEALTLNPAVIVERGRAMAANDSLPAEAIEAVTLPFYAGNLGRSRTVLNDGPLNTDDRPVIEHGSPQTHRSARAGSDGWFVGAELAGFLDAIARQTPPESDPYLAGLNSRQIGYVEAGRLYYRATLAEKRGDAELAKRYRAETAARIPAALLPSVDDSDVGAEME
jgi:spermidine synthase